MDIAARIESLTLKILSRNAVDRGEVESLLADVAVPATPAQAAISAELHKAIQKKRPDVQSVASLLEKMSAELKPAPQSAVVDDGRLSYDTTQPREIIDGFIAEVSGHLESIESQLLHLESRPEDAAALNSVFGAMHSLKGITGFMSLGIAHKLAHEAEAVMERARHRAGGISQSECDTTLRTVDGLRDILLGVRQHVVSQAGEFPPVPGSALAALKALQAIQSAPITNPMAADSPAAAESVSSTQRMERTGLVRVNVEKLETLLDAIGEMVVTQTQVHQDPALLRLDSPRLVQNLGQLNKITRELQTIAMSLRMTPVRELFGRMSRLLRDVAHKCGKDVEIVLIGEDTEMDRSVVQALVDPLTHLCRNAVDHGVDSAEARRAAGKPARATITLSAQHQGSNVVIDVRDDGGGLDTEKILRKARETGLVAAGATLNDEQVLDLVFESGFSTRDKVSELSGRGIGLDVVRRTARSLSGRVTVSTKRGQFTSFRLTLPLTLAIAEALVVRVGAERFIVPITSVVELLRPAPGQVSTVYEKGEVIDVRGEHLRMIRLSRFIHKPCDNDEPSKAIVLIVEFGDERCGLMVDELLGQQQIVIKTLGQSMRQVRGVVGGAVLGDGCVGLILDIGEVMALSRSTECAAV